MPPPSKEINSVHVNELANHMVGRICEGAGRDHNLLPHKDLTLSCIKLETAAAKRYVYYMFTFEERLCLGKYSEKAFSLTNHGALSLHSEQVQCALEPMVVSFRPSTQYLTTFGKLFTQGKSSVRKL